MDVIDLGFSCEYNDDLLNKYHHRHLVKNLIKNTFNSNSHCIFIVLFLDNIDFTTQLLPDIVKSEDFEEILKNLNKDKNEEFTILFNQIYFKSDDCVFQLNLNRNIESRDKINELLESLFKLFKDNLSQDLFQKYCISFLQEEIDTAIEYLDSDSIIWFNTKEFNLKKTTLETSLIDKLQKNVVKDNYAETDLNEFLRLRCRKIIDDLIDQKKTHKIASSMLHIKFLILKFSFSLAHSRNIRIFKIFWTRLNAKISKKKLIKTNSFLKGLIKIFHMN